MPHTLVDMPHTLGSLFDGIGGFPLVATMKSIHPVWASEIDEKAVSVTRRHFPDMKHLGDITKINGGEIEPVDIITFGSPCQNLSVAGNREGLAGEQSGLFMEAMRIINEMREKTDGKYPRFIVWENVRGALFSRAGRDFQTVLREITQADIPIPQSGRWANAGMVGSPRCDVAWRLLDAQFWGVPQHRERIFLVADFGTFRAPQLLFEPESLYGDPAKSETSWKGTAAGFGSGADRTSYSFLERCGKPGGGKGILIQREKTGSVKAKNNQNVFCLDQPLIYDARGNGDGNTAPTITGDHNNRVTDYTACVFRQSGFGGYVESGVSAPLKYSGGALGGGTESCVVNEVAGTIDASYYKGQGARNGKEREFVIDKNLARRLTPKECERLQGFPDGWTETGADGEKISDSARYRMIGNSVAIPCVYYVFCVLWNIEGTTLESGWQ